MRENTKPQESFRFAADEIALLLALKYDEFSICIFDCTMQSPLNIVSSIL